MLLAACEQLRGLLPLCLSKLLASDRPCFVSVKTIGDDGCRC